MQINFAIKSPSIFGRKKANSTIEAEEPTATITIPAYVVVGTVLAAGVIFRQYLEITSLRQTLIFLQETARG